MNVCRYLPARFAEARLVDEASRQAVRWENTEEYHDQDDEYEHQCNERFLPDSGTHLAAATDSRKRPSDELDQPKRRRMSEPKQTLFTKRDVKALLRRTHARVLTSPPVQPGDPRYIHITEERAWSCYQVMVVREIATRVPMVAASIRTLKNMVMSDGLKFMRENVELLAARDFGRYIVRRLHPFAFDCVDAMLLLGVVPVAYEYDPVLQQCWPYVPAIGTYVIKRHTVAGAVRYRFYWTSEAAFRNSWRRELMEIGGKKVWRWQGRQVCQPGCGPFDSDTGVGGVYDPSVEIIYGLGSEIRDDGGLTSKIASLIPMATQRNQLNRARAVAELNAAAPPLVTEHNHQADVKQSQNLKQSYFASVAAPPDIADTPEAIESMTFERNAAQKEAMKAMMRAVEAETGRDASMQFGVPHEEYRDDVGGTAITKPEAKTAEGVSAQWSTQFHLGYGRSLVTLPAPHVSTDYVSVLQQMDDEIFAVLGVPKTYVLGDSIRAGTELATNRLSDETQNLKRSVSDILTHVYNAIFLADDINQYMTSDYRRERLSAVGTDPQQAAPALIDENDLYVIDSMKNVRVTFAKKPSDQPEELLQMLAFGAIDESQLCAEFARRNGFDSSQLCTGKAMKIPDEMKLALVPQFMDFMKLELEKKKHEDTIALQRETNEQQADLKQAEMKSKEKQTETAAKAKAASGAGSGGGGASGGAKKAKTGGSLAGDVAKASSDKSSGYKGPSLSDISKAASTLAAAGAAIKKKKEEEKAKSPSK